MYTCMLIQGGITKLGPKPGPLRPDMLACILKLSSVHSVCGGWAWGWDGGECDENMWLTIHAILNESMVTILEWPYWTYNHVPLEGFTRTEFGDSAADEKGQGIANGGIKASLSTKDCPQIGQELGKLVKNMFMFFLQCWKHRIFVFDGLFWDILQFWQKQKITQPAPPSALSCESSAHPKLYISG
jgi:hypothetical protein